MIETAIVPITESCRFLEKMLREKFNISEISPSLRGYLDQLKKSLWLFVEYPYVDKLYRDTYYHYFSSKLFDYDRNSIRVSFFEEQIEMEDFRNVERFSNHLQKHFCGFLIVRPMRKCIGRNIVSPVAFGKKEMAVRTTTINITVNGVKLFVEGFPHCSQDGEAMSCAETTVWSLVEYFSTKYPEYNSVLPSTIRGLLNQYSNERLLPTAGLSIGAVSYVIKKLGFGSKGYPRESFKSNIEEYFQLIHCYIESGIPIFLCLTKEHAGHAAICIGRKNIDISAIINVSPKTIGGANIYDINTAKRELVIIDDNHPPYQVAELEEPVSYYTNWKDFEISFFIVPLHPKIYLEASQAKEFLYAFLDSGLIELAYNSNLFTRLFLTSSRSLKYNINQSSEGLLKELVITLELPKFVWVAEVSSEKEVAEGYASGLIIFDATETDYKSFNGLIFAALEGQFLEKPAEKHLGFKNVALSLPKFKIFTDNLRFYK